jgi:hypothetical protein
MRRLVRLAVVASLALPAIVLPAVPASAVIDLTCTASSNVTFSPGLLLVERQQTITFNVGYNNCISLSHPEITSGTRSGMFNGPRGCLSLPPSAPTTVTLTWNTGATSTASVTGTGQDVGGQTVHTLTGTVTSGVFTGALFVEVITQAAINLLQCLTPPGVTGQSGVGVLEIT